MAGALEYEPGVTPTTTIPVKRLLAKVTAVLSCDWNGAKIKSAKVYNMNKVLKPFGTSAASGSSDMLGFQEVQTAAGAGTNSLTGTFYVPENMQGTVSGITVSENKAGDKNATVSANASKLTYLEVTVESEGKYDGDIVYRSYLGNNATTNFDIQRNYRYVWTIHYKSDTVEDFNDDWKHDYDGLEIIDYRLSLSPDPNTITAGSNFTYTTTLARDVIKPTTSSTSTTLENSNASWSSSNTAVATVSSSGVVTGIAAGTANITARYTPAGYDLSERTATASVTVQTVAHELVISNSTAITGLHHDQSATLNATYYTVTNGVRDTGTDVTSSATWSHSGGTKYAVSAGVVTANATSSSPSVEGTTTITATYNGDGSNSIDVAFVDITNGTVTVSPASASGTYVSPAVFSATYVGTVNGFTTENINVTNTATWNATGAKYSVTNGSVSADASIGDHSVAGSSTVTATYGGVTSNSATANFTDVTENTMVVTPASGSITAGGANVNLTAYYKTNTNGYETGNVDVTTNASNTWSSNNSNVTVGAHTGVVTANLSATGIAVITATYSGKSASCTLIVGAPDITNYLTVTPNTASANVGETIALTAMYHTVTNGVDDGGVDVTTNASTSWSRQSGDSTISVDNAGSNKGHVTATAGGSAVIQASYGGEPATATVTFNNVITYELEVTGNSSAKVGETINLTATLWTLTNGVRTSSSNVTTDSKTVWSPTSGTIKVNNSGSDKGKVTATGNGTVTIYATYNSTYSGQKDVTFSNVDEIRYRIVIDPSSASINWGATQTYTVKRYEDTYRNGSLYITGTTTTNMAAADFTWTTESSAIATVSSGMVTGTGTGTTTVKATLKSTVDGYSKYTNTTVSGDVTVNQVVTHRLVLSADYTSRPYNGTINLTAKYYTTTNGVENSGENVTPSSFSKSGGSNITLTAGNPSTAKLTNSALSNTANNSADVTATYAGTTSNSVHIEFTNVTTYRYSRLVVTGDSNVSVGGTTSDYTATVYTQTVVNGADSGAATPTNVSGSATFSISNGTGSATISGRRATGVSAGVVYVCASYSGTYGTITSTSGDRATLTVGNVEEDRYRIEIEPISSTINWNATQAYIVNRYTDHYVNGTRTTVGTTAYTMSNSDFTWTSSKTGVATVNSAGTARGVYEGTTTIKATLKSSASEYSKYSNTEVTSTLNVNNVLTYELVITKSDKSAVPAGLQLAVDYTRSLKAWYRTYTNGSLTNETEVTSTATWTASPAALATVSAGSVTGVSSGMVTITASSTPSGKPNKTASVTIEVVGGSSDGWDDGWDDDGGEIILD